jgi:hypothetical protein
MVTTGESFAFSEAGMVLSIAIAHLQGAAGGRSRSCPAATKSGRQLGWLWERKTARMLAQRADPCVMEISYLIQKQCRSNSER